LGKTVSLELPAKNSRHLAVEAVENGADYVAFGAFFATNTKQGATPAELETVRWWNEMTTVPSVVIGGITIENCRPLISAGADFLAIVGGVWDHPEGEAAAVKAFNKAFENST
jgi:thiamine-phosphate pyrophosphorylase